MLKLSLYPRETPFRHPFSISRKSKTTQPSIIVKLEGGGGCGLGEATANSYYNIDLARLQKDLTAVQPLLKKESLTTPQELWEILAKPLKDNPFALCAIDQAAWDLYAKKRGQKLYEVWGLDVSRNPLTSYTIGIDRIEKMVEKIKEFHWPVYKIKLGAAEDMAIIKALRKETDALFRVDANCAWSLQQTIDYSTELKELNVEFIEQPMADPGEDQAKWQELEQAYKNSALPLIADESCISESDVEKCHGYFHGINIKLVKCGGLTPALRMIEEARKREMKVMVGSMNENVVGSTAAAHLLPLLDYIDLDGPLLLAKHFATGITYKHGKIIFPDRMGTGAELL